MRRLWVSGALAAVIIGFLIDVPGLAADTVCAKSGTTLTVTAPAYEPQVHLWVGFNGGIIVDFEDHQHSCTDDNGKPIELSTLHSIELFQQELIPAPTSWALAPDLWTPSISITIHNDGLDKVSVNGTTDANNWHAVAAATPLLSVRDEPLEAELFLDAVPATTRLATGDGDDTVDLAVDGGAWTGSNWIYPGNGADVISGGAGDDRVFDHSDGDPDAIQPGGGYDELDLDASLNGAVVDPTSPGGDGIAGNDDYGRFEMFRGTAGPDRFIAPASGMTAAGLDGDDRFVPGPGNDTFYGGWLEGTGWSEGDTVTYAQSDTGITLSPTDDISVEQVTGQGNDSLIGVYRLVGSRHADTVHATVTKLVRPGLGDDRVGFDFSGRIIAEPGEDGNDELLPDSTSAVMWNYTARTAPLRLTADGVANDGMPGERDNIDNDAEGIDILGGRSDDVIVGDNGDNFIHGGDGYGDDRLIGRGGRDSLWGGHGRDVLKSGGGNDTVSGGEGNDLILEGSQPNGADDLYGSLGRDTLSYAARASSVDVTVGNGRCDDGAPDEGDCVRRTDPFEVIIGTPSADRLSGYRVGEHLLGGAGEDILAGGEGADVLTGQGGNDRLSGGPGTDSLNGDDGADHFYAKDSTKDTLNGGRGKDLAWIDAIDLIHSIESAS